MSGIAAVDLYENKLGQPDKALEVLVGLHQRRPLHVAGARAPRRAPPRATGAWARRPRSSRQLMTERDTREGRIEAARLAMAIWRDKLGDADARRGARSRSSCDEAPDDGEALDLVLDHRLRHRLPHADPRPAPRPCWCSARRATRSTPIASRCSPRSPPPRRTPRCGRRRWARWSRSGATTQASPTSSTRSTSGSPARPQIALDAHALAEIADPEDSGPVAGALPR